VATQVLIDRERAPLPDTTSKRLRDVAEACWQHDAQLRPSFGNVLQALRLDEGANIEATRHPCHHPRMPSYI
jgi:hypothetical protein